MLLAVNWLLNQRDQDDPAAEMIEFRIAPQEVERNGDVDLWWDVRGVDTVALQVRYGSYKQAPDVFLTNLPAETAWTHNLMRRSLADPDAITYIHNVQFWLLTPSEDDSAWTPGYLLLTTGTVEIICPYDGFFFGDDPTYDFCPLADPRTIEAIYQPFENGFLVWHSDRDEVYAFHASGGQNQGSAVRFSNGQEIRQQGDPNQPAPSDHYEADHVFVEVRNSGHGAVIGLGKATAAATTYYATVQDTYHDTLNSAVIYMTMPDERNIRYLEDIYTSGWACLNCQS